VAHEVRNALIPVRHDIDVLRASAMELEQQRRLDDARGGVVRVLAFVDEMVQTSELITEPAILCDLRALVDEAAAWIDAEKRVERSTYPDPIHLLAPRVRLTRAISNVVRNAMQATTEGQPIRLSMEQGRGVVRVIVDDGGPGVSSDHRTRIFLEGVTMRQDGGGSGFGLAFARRVVEGDLHGKIWCEDSDLGGARFVIEVPEPNPR
jgi:signal transduction histidine kinase